MTGVMSCRHARTLDQGCRSCLGPEDWMLDTERLLMFLTEDPYEDGSGDPYDVRRQRCIDDAVWMLRRPWSRAPGMYDVRSAELFLAYEGVQRPSRVLAAIRHYREKHHR